MALHVYDTRTREKRPFETARTGEVDMYVCGITPYSPSHLGHARCYIAFDLIHRWLEASGWTVHYVQNFTDIDDKIINKANEEGIDFLEVANRNIEDYYTAMDALNVLRADHYPRVTEVVPEIITMVEILIEKEHAYVADDGVWFDVESAPEKYGVLTGQSIDAVKAGAGGRVEDSGKRDHKDFALWKVAKPGEPAWPSPWGDGRPGWHIECSAMSLKHFGEQFDIHGGGHDLRFPHHEAEIFQSECCTGKEPLVRFWMHNGFVNVDGEKMSKSLGNFWTITDALEKYEPLVLRHALLNAHYRSPIDLSEQLLEDAKRHHAKIVEVYGHALVIIEMASKAGIRDAPRLPKPDLSSDDFLISKLGLLEKLLQEAAVAMDDDFNSRQALAKVSNGAKIIPQILESEGIDEQDTLAFAHYAVDWIEEFAGEVLGLLPDKTIAMAAYDPNLDPARQAIKDDVEALLARRAIARAAKDWESADQIRDELAAMGVVVKDTPDGVIWNLE
ncbi:MAG: cysteine--tRNA ligase [Candidatus Thermoplasmatota archaeon]|nr:cysteine--tRNA ligase [Candidatus Thermoplasmatota archaeon]